MKRITKIISILLMISMIGSLLTGCGKKEEETNGGTGTKETSKGRYVETALSLPEGVDSDNIIQIGKEDGQFWFLLKEDSGGVAVYKKFMYQSEGNMFEEQDTAWLNELEIPYLSYSLDTLTFDKSGNQYFFAIYSEEEAEDAPYKGFLFRKNERDEVTEITPDSWKKLQEDYNYYEYPNVIQALEGGYVAAIFYDRIDIVNAESGELSNSISVMLSGSAETASLGDSLYVMNAISSGENGIQVYNKSGELEQEIPFTLSSFESAQMDVLENGDIILAVSAGVYQWSTIEGAWNLVIPGNYTSLDLRTMWCRGIVGLEDETFYSFFGSDEGAQLFQYVYDADIVIEISTTLKVYTINECSAIKQAAALYQKEHPEVKVEVETAISYDDYYSQNYDMNAIYTTLNGKLLSGDAADVLIMDGLDIDSFKEKGLLLDIDEVITGLESEGKLLSNITESYKEENGRFVVPLRFSIPLLVCKGDLKAEENSSIEALAKAAAESKETLLGERTATDLTTMFAPYFIGEIVDGKELNEEKLAEYLEYIKVIGNNCGLVNDYGEDMRANNVWEIPSKIQAAIEVTEGFNQAMFPLSVVKLVNGTYTGFNNTYFPLFEAGIYSKTKEPEIAKDFLAFALSEEVQNTDFYDGFPINQESLVHQSKADRTDAQAYTTIAYADGSYQEFEIGTYDDDTAKKLMELCQKLNNSAVRDAKIEEEIAAALPGYLNGTDSLETTIQKIGDGLRMYLAE